MALSKKAILGSKRTPFERVDTPAWGDDETPVAHRYVNVRLMDGRLRDIWEARVYPEKGKFNGDNLRAFILSLTICDDDGQPVFSEADCEDLGKLDWPTLDAVAQVAYRINKLTRADVEAEKKDSSVDPSAASGSVSPDTSEATP